MLPLWVRQPVLGGLIAALLVAAAFGAGLFVGSDGVAAVGRDTNAPTNLDTAPLWKAWNILDEKFVPATSTALVSEEERLYGAIEGLARSYNDPYTTFLPPKEKEIFEEDIRGNFEGVGMEIGIRDEVLTVISPLKDSPAERAGVEAGDRILEIDGTTTEGISIEHAVSLIRGERGSSVVLTIAREGRSELLELSITRDVIEIPTIDTTLRDDGVFVIALHNFSAISPELFRESLRKFIESGSTDLLLDLRGNPGGYLQAAVSMASWFLPAGKVVVVEDFGDGEQNIYRSRGYDVFNDNLDMAILINRGSASASEILAGALSEHGVATLVGERTFGKGSVQELIEITDRTSLKVTIARWLTPNGTSISAGGLEPDVEISVTQEDVEAGSDPQLEGAAALLTSQ